MNIDVKLITENFVEILTNTINIASLFEQIFNASAEPAEIETVQYVYDEDQEAIVPKTILVDNMAKIKADLENSVSGEIGAALEDCVKYEDIATSSRLGILKIDGSTIKMNGDSQVYVDPSSLNITRVESAANADAASIANTLLNEKDNEGISVWVGSQAEFNNIQSKDSSVLYFVREETV